MRLNNSRLVWLFLWLLSAPLNAGMDFDDGPIVMDDRPLYEKSYALVIGVSDYGDTGWQSLPGVAEDVQKVAEALKLTGFNHVYVVSDPGVDRMKAEIRSFLRDFGDNWEHRLLVYYAGHGASVTNEDGNPKGYIVPADVPLPDNNPGEYGAVSMDWIRTCLGEELPWREEEDAIEQTDNDCAEVMAKHVMFVFDSCFSGSIFENTRRESRPPPVADVTRWGGLSPLVADLTRGGSRPPAVADLTRGGSGASLVTDPVREESRPPLIADLAQKRVHQFLSSGSGTQEVPDVSIFRREFIAALAGSADMNRDGFITGSELSIYVRGRVSNASEGAQTPQFSKTIADGDMLFVSPVGAAEGAQARQEQTSVEAQDLAVGDTFRDCADCPEMVVIPAGSMLPESDGQEQAFSESGTESGGAPQEVASINESPGSLSEEQEEGSDRREFETRLSPVMIQQPFAISVYEVTAAQWNTCFSEGVCTRWLPMPAAHSDRHPVAGVTRNDAEQFVEWLRWKTGRRYRLPSEEQWEYAARAGSTTARHWGEDIGVNQAACDGCGSSWDGESAAPVGSFEPNRFGLYDALGNLWEWTSDCEADENPYGACVIKGGSWATDESEVRASARGFYPSEHSQPNFGIRVVRGL